MYVENQFFAQPPNENVKVWRYMDFTKLVSMLQSRCLYFTRSDKFEDPFEGSWPMPNVKLRHEEIFTANLADPGAVLTKTYDLFMFLKDMRRLHAINCWHMNEHESAAMWTLYLKSNEGIAIQSTYQKLRASIIDDERVHVGVVKYIDYKTEPIDSNEVISAFTHKRKSFEHEREVRAVIHKWPANGKSPSTPEEEPIGHGIEVRVDLDRLIEKIHISPTAPGWFSDLVANVVKQYGYKFEVTQSLMNEKPTY